MSSAKGDISAKGDAYISRRWAISGPFYGKRHARMNFKSDYDLVLPFERFALPCCFVHGLCPFCEKTLMVIDLHSDELQAL